MMSKAIALGLEFDPAVQSKYSLPLDPKFALDTKHESWNPLWAFPKNRSIAADSSLADSVYVRVTHDSSYRPANLTITEGALASTYGRALVVSQAALQAAG